MSTSYYLLKIDPFVSCPTKHYNRTCLKYHNRFRHSREIRNSNKRAQINCQSAIKCTSTFQAQATKAVLMSTCSFWLLVQPSVSAILEQEYVHSISKDNNETALIAGFLDFANNEKDPVDPFTLYGSVFKKFVIEKLNGEKVVSRRKGFTVDACVSAVQAIDAPRQFQRQFPTDKVDASRDTSCVKAESEVLASSCTTACHTACTASLDSYAADNEKRTGYIIEEGDLKRVGRGCERRCEHECSKPGKAYDFSISFRR